MEALPNHLRRPTHILLSSIRLSSCAKVVFDISFAALGLILLSPVFVLIGILIKRDSPGPVFYRGLRMGRDGRPFKILKFRTMFEEPSSYNGPRLTSSEDQRITPLGRWLRQTKINELPQLWNVLTGEMSLVGPRPEDPDIVEVYPKQLRNEIMSVRPGITSPASILYHSEENLLTGADLMHTYLNTILPDKLRLDQLYIRNRSLASDLDTIFWTLAIFIPRLAKSSVPEGYLFAGPFTRLINRHFSWFVVDSITAFIAICITSISWRIHAPLEWGWGQFAILSLVLAFLFSTVNYLAGLNRIIWSKARGEDAISLLCSGGSTTLLTLLLNYLQQRHLLLRFPALPMDLVLTIGILATAGFVCVRYRFRLLTWLAETWSGLQNTERGIGERVLILGDGETSHIASWLLRQGMFRHAFSVVGVVASEDPTKQGMRLEGCRVLGWIRDLPAIIQRNDVRMIVYALPGGSTPIQETVFNLSRVSHIRLVFLDDLMAFIAHQSERPAAAGEYLEWLQRRSENSQLHDALTQLPNATLLQERIQHSIAWAKRYKTNAAMMLINLNGLDGRFRRAENELMQMASKRLLAIKRESDTLARLGGHEFALLLENVPDENAAQAVVRRTKELISQPFLMRDASLSMHADMELYFPLSSLQQISSRLGNHSDIPTQPVITGIPAKIGSAAGS